MQQCALARVPELALSTLRSVMGEAITEGNMLAHADKSSVDEFVA